MKFVLLDIKKIKEIIEINNNKNKNIKYLLYYIIYSVIVYLINKQLFTILCDEKNILFIFPEK